MAETLTVLEQVKIRLRQFHMEDITEESVDEEGNTITTVVGQKRVFDNLEENPVLEQLIFEAWEDIRRWRQYPDYWVESRITSDLAKYSHVAVKLAMYDYVKEGADFENTNNENGQNRNYIKREEILNAITPLVTALNVKSIVTNSSDVSEP